MAFTAGARVQKDRRLLRTFAPKPTVAEIRVLELVALGLTSREIAERLWVSRQTVTYHIGNLLTKLEAESRAGLVARAYALGVLGAGSWPPRVAFAPVTSSSSRVNRTATR
jgi:DNA-binding CsgD family transcriptional regulator